MATEPIFRRGISLYDYQVETMDRIIQMEANTASMRGHIPLTEPFGSGKTFIILGLIMKSPVPAIGPVMLCGSASRDPYATLEIKYANQIIRPSAIIVARSVYAQWLRNLRTYTTLRVFEVKDKPTARKLAVMATNGETNDYDVVLIKYGKTSGIADGKCELCKIISGETLPLVWARAIYDDVDLIAESTCMRAISSIFVTGATDFKYYKKQKPFENPVEHADTRDLLVDLPRVSHVFCSGQGSIWTTLGHKPDRIAREHGVYALVWTKCSILNTEIHRATRLISIIEAVNCEELLSMINGDAMISAARMLNISVVTPRAMFARVLGAQRADYKRAKARIDILEHLRADDTTDINPETRAEAEGASESLGTFHMDAMLKLQPHELEEMITDIRAYLARLDRSFMRIRENMTDQVCQICYSALGGEHVTIMRCCGFVICESCCARACKFEKGRNGHVVGICAQCRQQLDFERDVIFVESGANIDALLQDAMRDKDASVEPPISPPPVREPDTTNITTKIGYVVALIRGQVRDIAVGETHKKTLTIKKITMPEISGVMNGTQVVAPTGARSILICTQFDEAIETISVALTQNNIQHATLQGTISEFAHILDSYARGAVRVLVINARALYAGVDLQMTTDIVIFGANKNLGQLIGRAQRLGRECSLIVHILEYVDKCV